MQQSMANLCLSAYSCASSWKTTSGGHLASLDVFWGMDWGIARYATTVLQCAAAHKLADALPVAVHST